MYSTVGGYNNRMEPPRLLTQLGGYQIEAVLGQGAVAVVYRARSPQGRTVALKVLTDAAASQRRVRMLFQSEYRICSRLNHPGVVRVLDAGEIDGHPFMAMEVVAGKTLQDFVRKDKGLGETASLDIVRQLAATLDYIHQQQVVHRDLKPTNVFITQNGRALLFDFGTALDLRNPPTEPDTGIYGTPGFLAPEQIQHGDQVDGRADLYSLGIIFYRLLTGRRPFYGTRDDVLDAHLHTPPPPPSEFAYVSPGLEAIVLKLLAKDPDKRFRTGAELLQALENVELVPEPENAPQRLMRWLFNRQSASD
ncbi:MAG TPA: serine/threonine-protein kinase [Caldilineaceae bacterium]|nr:serine/threonine-protein kinase [Caldilineaceae bacterium]